jgi:hypothetical protein
MANAPFPLPAHQTGRAGFPHPAFRLVSPWAHGETGLARLLLGQCRSFASRHSDLGRFRSFNGVSRLIHQSPGPRHLRKRTRSQGPSLRRNYPGSTVLCPCPTPARSAAICDVEAATSDQTGLPRYPLHPSGVPCPIPRRIERVHLSVASPSVRPSPFCRRVGIRISTFEACSGFTRVTARRIAQPPKAAFVTRLRSSQLPGQTARQLPGQSTIPWVEPSSTGETRPRGALQKS